MALATETRNDTEIRRDVLAELKWEPRVRPNDIEVRRPSLSERTDTDIAAAAARAIEWDGLIPPKKVQMTVTKGWVTLEGEVEWQYQRHEAKERAGGTDRR